jgi:hypothetical protein
MKVVSIHQPNYIPWLGYFYKISQSDIFVYLDDVQFTTEGMQNYHYIKTTQGRFRLKVPVNANLSTNINKATINNKLDWKKKHLKTVELNYKKAPFFREIFTDYNEWLDFNTNSIGELDINIVKNICNKFNLKTEFIISSELKILSSREEKVLDICSILNASIYYSGTGAKSYQNEDNFIQRGIQLKYSIFKPFIYPQLWGDFQSNVSIIDYLMNCGYDWDRVIKNQDNG